MPNITISDLFYIVSRAVRRVRFGAILKYPRVVFMPNVTYNSYYYMFILLPEKFSHLTPCVYFRRVVSLRRRANWFSCSELIFGPADPDIEPGRRTFLSILVFRIFF